MTKKHFVLLIGAGVLEDIEVKWLRNAAIALPKSFISILNGERGTTVQKKKKTVQKADQRRSNATLSVLKVAKNLQ